MEGHLDLLPTYAYINVRDQRVEETCVRKYYHEVKTKTENLTEVVDRVTAANGIVALPKPATQFNSGVTPSPVVPATDNAGKNIQKLGVVQLRGPRGKSKIVLSPNPDMKVPRRIVVKEIRQGTFQILRKVNFSI